MKPMWLAVLAVLVLFAALTFTVDPLGLLGPKVDVDGDDEEASLEAEGGETGLKTRGTARGIDDGTYQGDPIGVLDLGLGGAALKGLVQNEEEAPISRARVTLLIPAAEGRGVRTKTDGTYELRGLPEGQHDLRASAEGFRTHTEVGPKLLDGEEGEAPTMTLRPRPGLRDGLIVRVTDPFGKPVPGAKVIATTMPWDMHLAAGPERAGIPEVRFRRGVTNDDGKIAMRQMIPDDYNVGVWAAGYATQAKMRVMISGGGEKTVTFRMAPSVAVRGTVVNAAGDPVPDAVVMGMKQPDWQSSISTRSGEDGTFVLDDLHEGQYFFAAYGNEGGDVFVPGKAPSTGVVLKLSGSGVIKGKVVDTEGEAVGEATVRPYKDGWFQYTYSQTYDIGADGAFEISLPKGAYSLEVKTASGTVAQVKQVKVENGETTEIEIKIDRNNVVRGVVVDERGDHVSGAEVFIKRGGVPPDKSRENYALTDAEGAFEVKGLAPETITLHVWHPDYANTTFEATAVAPENAEEVRVSIKRGASVMGRIADADDMPVVGEEVSLMHGFMESRTVMTDANGRYAFHAVAVGKADLKTGPVAAWRSGLRAEVQVPEDGVITHDFTMPARGGTVTGVVMLAGKPVPGAAITVTDTRGVDGARTGTTDEEGRFEIAGVEIGSVRIEARAPSGQEGRTGAEVSKETNTAEATVTIGSAGVRARILDSEGQPLPSTWCSLEVVGEGESSVWGIQLPTTGSDGITQSSSVRSGKYKLRVNHQQHAQYVSQAFSVVDGQVADLGDIRLKRTVQVTGRVVDDTGKPVENATASLTTPEGKAVFMWSMATSGSDGRYVLSGVEPGQYFIKFEAKGLAPQQKPIQITTEGATADGTLVRGGGISFKVETDTGEPVAGAKLTLIDSRGLEVKRTYSMVNWTDSGTRYTNDDGVSSIADLAAGSYRVVAEKSGFTAPAQGVPVRVTSGETSPVKVVMSPTAGE